MENSKLTENYEVTDLGKFGNREIEMAADLLTKMHQVGLPNDFTNEDVKIMMNPASGNVFLTNSEYETAMVNPDSSKLEVFYATPEEGIEGFVSDLVKEYPDMSKYDQLWFRDIAKTNNIKL